VATISLGCRLPGTSGGRPGGRRDGQPRAGLATGFLLLGLAPDGVCRAGPVTRAAGELLPHRFTLTCGETPPAVCSLWHFPWPRGRWALPTIAPCGARTFLPPGRSRREPFGPPDFPDRRSPVPPRPSPGNHAGKTGWKNRLENRAGNTLRTSIADESLDRAARGRLRETVGRDSGPSPDSHGPIFVLIPYYVTGAGGVTAVGRLLTLPGRDVDLSRGLRRQGRTARAWRTYGGPCTAN